MSVFLLVALERKPAFPPAAPGGVEVREEVAPLTDEAVVAVDAILGCLKVFQSGQVGAEGQRNGGVQIGRSHN